MEEVILAGDIGGTKTHLALFRKDEPRKWIVDAKFKSPKFSSLLEIIKEFLSANKQYKVAKVCLGIAGPIQDRKCKATNLPWIIDAASIEEELKIPAVFLINDLEANAYGIQCLQKEELFTLNEGKVHPGNGALIAAGTGLGEAGLFWDGKRHIPFACEGGHCSFSPENEIEMRLLAHLQKQYDHVSFERVLSGPGLYALYRFLIEEKIEKESDAVRKLFEVTDPPKVITAMGMQNADLACARALDLFVSIYGGEAANLALKFLSVGGIFIGGGIAPKILNALGEGAFMKRFIKKGRFTSLLLGIPVKVILNENTALLGSALYAKKDN